MGTARAKAADELIDASGQWFVATLAILGCFALLRLIVVCLADMPTVTIGATTVGPVATAALVSAWFASRSRMEGFALAAKAVALFAVTAAYLPDANEAAIHLARSYPYADDALAAADRTLGFDWLAYVRLFDSTPLLWWISERTYLTINIQPGIILVVLAATRASRQLYAFFLAQNLCLLAVAAMTGFAPALGAYEHYDAAHAMLAHGDADFAVAAHMTRSLEWLRQNVLAGPGVEFHALVSFPSYHAMCCVLFVWATWGIPMLRWPALGLNVAMAVATPIQGSHYLVDLLAGAAIAVAAIFAAAWILETVGRVQPASPREKPALA